MRVCPFQMCQIKLPDHQFACRQHWFSLTLAEKQEINAAYDAYEEDEIGIEQLREIQDRVILTVLARRLQAPLESN